MKIYDKDNRLILDVTVDDNSYRNRAIMGDHNLTLYYSLAQHVEIPVGSYCEFQGKTYTLMHPEQFKMKHKREYTYTVTFSSEQDKAKIWKFRNPVDGRLKFSLTAKPKEHLQMFVDNMNRRDVGWTTGECVEDVEKLISYDHDYCWDALTKMATEFKTEFEIEDKRVSLHKVEYDKSNPLPLSYGRGNGFKSGVGRSNSGDTPPVETLFVQGGEQNIDRSKYPEDETLRATSNGCLLLPVGQTIGYDGEHFDNETGYNEDEAWHYLVDDLGLSIRNIDREPSSLAEDSLDRSDDYPKRVGTVSKVIEVDTKNNFYDFIDSSIPDDLNYEDYLIEGEAMTVIFQSGMLAGREFDVKYYHNAKNLNGVEKAGKRFEIVPQEIDGVTMPNEQFKPEAGKDTYAIFHVMLPDAYIRNDVDKSGASWDMFRAAVKYLYDNEERKYTFTGELDGIWAKKDWLNIGGRIRLGGFVRFTDENFEKDGVLVRITNIKDYVNNPHAPKIELSNETVSGTVTSTIKQLEATEVIAEEYRKEALQFTKRRFRDAKETIEMLEAALSDKFTNRINPIAVETMSMLVGDERLQYQFVSAPGNTEAVPHNIIWNSETRQLIAPAGTIQHLTLGINSISPQHEASEYRYWNVESYESSILDNTRGKYYLYIRAKKESAGQSAAQAVFRLSSKTHALDEGNYYWFLVGILNSEYDGERSFVTLYGFSEVLPGRITTDRIATASGDSYFDMLNGAMKLKDKLQYNIDGNEELKIKGVIVQSQSGQQSYIGCFRGKYNAAYTYYEGDEVTYAIGENISTYRYISPTPSKGNAPTSSDHWQVTAKGQQGDAGKDGTSFSIKGTAQYHVNSWDDVMAVTGDLWLVDGEDSSPYVAVFMHTWSKKAAEIGDAYLLGDTGELYVATESFWQNCGIIKGEPGEKGAQGEKGSDGNYTELRFAVNGSTTKPPTLTETELDPPGWSTTVPPVGNETYLWMTCVVKSADGKTMTGQWSTPIRISPYDGKNGENGKSPVMVYRGIYDSDKTYYGNPYRLDCVKHGDTYYIARIDAETFSSITPPDTSKWNKFGASFESVATQLLLAEKATIGNWFIQGDNIASTHGTVNGAVSSDFGNPDFVPDIILNGKDGVVGIGEDMTLDRDGLSLFGNGYPRVRITDASIGDFTEYTLKQSDTLNEDKTSTTGTFYLPYGNYVKKSETLERSTKIVKSIGFLDVGSTITIKSASAIFNAPVPVDVNTSVQGTVYGKDVIVRIRLDGGTVHSFSASGSKSGVGRYGDTQGESMSFAIDEGGTYTVKRAGNYIVEFGLEEIWLAGGQSTTLSSTTLKLSFEGSFKRGNYEKTLLGNDGIISLWPESAFFHSKTVSISQIGNYGLRVDKTGVYKIENGELKRL